MRPYLHHLRARCAAYLGSPLLLLAGLCLGPLMVVLLDWLTLDERAHGHDWPLSWSGPVSFYLCFQLLILFQARGCSIDSATVLRPGVAPCPALPLRPLGRAFTEALVAVALPGASCALCLLGLGWIGAGVDRSASDMLHQALLSDSWRLAAAALPLLTGIGLLTHRGADGLRIIGAIATYLVLLRAAEAYGLLAAPQGFAAVGAGWAGLVWLSRSVSSVLESGWPLGLRPLDELFRGSAGPLVRPGLQPLVRLRRDALLGPGRALLYGAAVSAVPVLLISGVALWLHERPPIELYFVPSVILFVFAATFPFGRHAGAVSGGGGGQVGYGPTARAWSILPVPLVQVARPAYVHALTFLLLPAAALCVWREASFWSCGAAGAVSLMLAGAMVVGQYGPGRYGRIMAWSFVSLPALAVCDILYRPKFHFGFLVLMLISWALISLVLPFRVLLPARPRPQGRFA